MIFTKGKSHHQYDTNKASAWTKCSLTTGSFTISMRDIMFGPPRRFSKILISRLIFFFFTGYREMDEVEVVGWDRWIDQTQRLDSGPALPWESSPPPSHYWWYWSPQRPHCTCHGLACAPTESRPGFYAEGRNTDAKHQSVAFMELPDINIGEASIRIYPHSTTCDS